MPSFENEISEAHRGMYAGFGYPGTVRLTDKERMALVSKISKLSRRFGHHTTFTIGHSFPNVLLRI